MREFFIFLSASSINMIQLEHSPIFYPAMCATVLILVVYGISQFLKNSRIFFCMAFPASSRIPCSDSLRANPFLHEERCELFSLAAIGTYVGFLCGVFGSQRTKLTGMTTNKSCGTPAFSGASFLSRDYQATTTSTNRWWQRWRLSLHSLILSYYTGLMHGS
jgi:hypothetical protein